MRTAEVTETLTLRIQSYTLRSDNESVPGIYDNAQDNSSPHVSEFEIIVDRQLLLVLDP